MKLIKKISLLTLLVAFNGQAIEVPSDHEAPFDDTDVHQVMDRLAFGCLFWGHSNVLYLLERGKEQQMALGEELDLRREIIRQKNLHAIRLYSNFIHQDMSDYDKTFLEKIWYDRLMPSKMITLKRAALAAIEARKAQKELEQEMNSSTEEPKKWQDCEAPVNHYQRPR